jgi:Ca2+-binding RTX toxin-like protein
MYTPIPFDDRQVNPDSTDTISNPQIASTPSGHFVVTWEADGNVNAQNFHREFIGTDGDDVMIDDNDTNYFYGRGGNDSIIGGAGNDTLFGNAGIDFTAGNDGNDRIIGGAGNDGLTGGAGRDWISGGAGDDRLDGGKGSDSLTGGTGADVFVFNSGEDFVEDFQNGKDTFDLTVFGFESEAEVLSPFKDGPEGSTIFKQSDGTTVYIIQTDISEIDANDFIF